MVRHLLVALLLGALLAPVLEAFDHWDSVPGLGSDTEFNVSAWAMTVGLGVVVALLVLRVRRKPVSFSGLALAGAHPARRTAQPLPFYPGCSPPETPPDTPLRI